MAELLLEATDKTPRVRLDGLQGILQVEGCSVHEDADGFYRPIFQAVERYAAMPAGTTRVSLRLDYFNSSTAKYLLDILKVLDELHVSGRSKVAMEWLHPEDDLDLQEAGMDYKALLDMPVKLVPQRS
ncbi:MAG: DUF1987 domain-containing protein [Flavobacteriales bacterium]|nr:DUF1987 domain-containing protein [Flavobacteriales bacterium]